MAMKRCPVCGEKYSDTYRTCPFCEEDAYWDEEEPRRPAPRGGRKTSSHGLQYNLITPTLIVLILIMALLLVYLLYGDKIASSFGGGKDDETDNPGVVDPVEPNPGGTAGSGDGTTPENPDGTGTENPDGEPADPDGSGGVMPEGTPSTPDTTPDTSSGGLSYADAAKLPSGLTLNKTDFTEPVSTGSVQLRASGGSGSYTWISENPGIASVDSSGKVTLVSAGTTNVLVTDGSKRAVCIVRVKGGSTPAPTSTPSSGGSGGENRLNKTDFTQSVSQGSVQLTLSGVTTGVTWSSSNTSVATVSGNGLVTPVGKGQATITASWDGQSRTCIVRVPG